MDKNMESHPHVKWPQNQGCVVVVGKATSLPLH
jgi:hypothetical protein